MFVEEDQRQKNKTLVSFENFSGFCHVRAFFFLDACKFFVCLFEDPKEKKKCLSKKINDKKIKLLSRLRTFQVFVMCMSFFFLDACKFFLCVYVQ